MTHIDSESDTESDIVLPNVDAEVRSQPFTARKTRSSGPPPLDSLNSLSIKAARKFAPHTREPSNKKKKAQKRKREHEGTWEFTKLFIFLSFYFWHVVLEALKFSSSLLLNSQQLAGRDGDLSARIHAIFDSP